MACHDDRAHTSVKHTHSYYVFCEFTLTSHDDLLTPTRDEEVVSCPNSTREVTEGSGVGSQTKEVSAIITRVLTSKEFEDGGLLEIDERGPKLDVRPNWAKLAKSAPMQPQRLQISGRG